MSSVTEKIIDLAHGVRLEFEFPGGELVPRLLSASEFAIGNLGRLYDWDRAIPYRRVVLCPRFTLNLPNLPS